MRLGTKEHVIAASIMVLIGFSSQAWPLAACDKYYHLGLAVPITTWNVFDFWLFSDVECKSCMSCAMPSVVSV